MLDNTTRLFLDQHKELGRFLCDALGPGFSCEIYSIDDVSCDGFVYALFGEIDNRRVGDPISPMYRHVLRSISDGKLNEVMHIDTEASTSDGRVKLSFLPVRDIMGRLCVLFVLRQNIELYCSAYEFLGRIIGKTSADNGDKKILDMVSGEYESLTNYMLSVIRGEIESCGVPVEEMSIDDKRQIVRALERKEVFYVRDSVRITSELLNISVPTVYRLLKKSMNE